MEYVFQEDEIGPDNELIFKTDIADQPDKPWWKTLLIAFVCGAIIGLLLWLRYDRIVHWTHIAPYVGGFAVLVSGLVLVPGLRNSELKKIIVYSDGFHVIRRDGKRNVYAWDDLQAAHFDSYPIANMRTNVSAFKFRTSGKNHELLIDGLGPRRIKLFRMVMTAVLEQHDIPVEAEGTRTFYNQLSMAGVGVFVVSIIFMAMAHLLAYHTLGTILGVSFMAAGVVISFMTRKQTRSQWVLVVAAMMIVATVGYIYAFDVNVQQTLQQWEQKERMLGRPPWEPNQPPAQPMPKDPKATIS